MERLRLNGNLGLLHEVRSPRSAALWTGRFGPLVGNSAPIRALFESVRRVAPTDATVFLIGDTGTGKEVVARAVHELSPRAARPFIAVNCSAISPQLIESELFGHEKGSFTGADHLLRGVFERADGGTLLLDEVTEMGLDVQVKLLRVLESSRFERVGGVTPIKSDVRILAATNRSPGEAVTDGKLRVDLYYRLNVFPLQLPTLRERGHDIVILARHFLAEIAEIEGRPRRFSAAALEQLVAHSWPGNVRELKNVVRCASILGEEEIGPESLRLDGIAAPILPASHGREPATPMLSFAPGTALAHIERAMILATLEHFQGDKRRSAEALGMSLKTLYVRLRQFRAQESPWEQKLPKSRADSLTGAA